MKPAIIMQTDFTRTTPAVCTMYGVCHMVDQNLRIFDNTHDIPSFDTYQASDALISIITFWEPGTIFVSVVDPTVGTSRKASVAKLKNGSYVVTPDNGSLTHIKKYFGITAVREIDESKHKLQVSQDVNIFHGRDLFAYCAAKLASGVITFDEVGKEYPIEEIEEHPIVEPYIDKDILNGMIANLDPHFGLVASNIPYTMFTESSIQYGDTLEVTIRERGKEKFHEKVTYQPSFGYVAVGEPVIVISENKMIQIAINQENFMERYQINCGPDWIISFKKL